MDSNGSNPFDRQRAFLDRAAIERHLSETLLSLFDPAKHLDERPDGRSNFGDSRPGAPESDKL